MTLLAAVAAHFAVPVPERDKDVHAASHGLESDHARTALMASRYRGWKFSPIVFEFKELDAVAELGVAGDDASPHAHGAIAEPERGGDISADGKWHHQFEVAAAPAKVGGVHTDGNVGAILAKFDLNLNGVAWIAAAVGWPENMAQKLLVGNVHGIGSGPVLITIRRTLRGLSAHRWNRLGRVSLSGY
jgi:hypothetical protein